MYDMWYGVLHMILCGLAAYIKGTDWLGGQPACPGIAFEPPVLNTLHTSAILLQGCWSEDGPLRVSRTK